MKFPKELRTFFNPLTPRILNPMKIPIGELKIFDFHKEPLTPSYPTPYGGLKNLQGFQTLNPLPPYGGFWGQGSGFKSSIENPEPPQGSGLRVFKPPLGVMGKGATSLHKAEGAEKSEIFTCVFINFACFSKSPACQSLRRELKIEDLSLITPFGGTSKI